MAIVHFVKSKRTQTVGGLNAVINYCCKDAKVDYHGRPLISGINCVPQCALQEFMNTNQQRNRRIDWGELKCVYGYMDGFPTTTISRWILWKIRWRLAGATQAAAATVS